MYPKTQITIDLLSNCKAGIVKNYHVVEVKLLDLMRELSETSSEWTMLDDKNKGSLFDIKLKVEKSKGWFNRTQEVPLLSDETTLLIPEHFRRNDESLEKLHIRWEKKRKDTGKSFIYNNEVIIGITNGKQTLLIFKHHILFKTFGFTLEDINKWYFVDIIPDDFLIEGSPSLINLERYPRNLFHLYAYQTINGVEFTELGKNPIYLWYSLKGQELHARSLDYNEKNYYTDGWQIPITIGHIAFEFYKKFKKEEFIPSFESEVETFLSEIDADRNNEIDVFEGGTIYRQLVSASQKEILEKQKEFSTDYLKNFMRLSDHINSKIRITKQIIVDARNNAPYGMFESYQPPKKQLEQYKNLLDLQMETINTLIISGVDMVTSLLDDDQITFYEYYEKLDKFNIWSSNYELGVLDKLDNISQQIDNLSQQLYDLQDTIIETSTSIIEAINLNTQAMHENMQRMDKHLTKINSQLRTSNILSGIQVYQTARLINSKS